MYMEIGPGDRVKRKSDGRRGKVIYTAFQAERELPVVWENTKEMRFVPVEELELCERS